MGTTLFVSVVLLFGFLLSIVLMTYAASDATVDVDARLTDGELQIQIQDWGQWRAPRGAGTLVTMRRRLRREVPV